MGHRKVLNSKSDLQGYSTLLVLGPLDMPHTISYLSSIATVSQFCIVSEILSVISINQNRLRDTEHTLFGCNLLYVQWYSSVSTRLPN